MTSPRLTLNSVSFSFPGRAHLLDDVSLKLGASAIYALMGANGAGKTTLFNILTGFIRPDSGKILWGATPAWGSASSLPPLEDITHLPPYKINRKGIGRTFQDLRTITKLTVKENVVLAMHDNPTDNWLKALLPHATFKEYLDALSKKADELIQEYFLDQVNDSLAGEISYGQQKLLTLACCVANGAKLLLLDEPVAGINLEYQRRMIGLLQSLREQGKTILMIEHNTEFIQELEAPVYFLAGGRIATFPNVELMRQDTQVMEAYM
jgi:branched-chain amino acid transport system ATP-binding protein